MKRFLLLAALLVTALALANTNKQGLTATAKVRRVELTLLRDGGCSLVAVGTYEVDAGAVLGSSLESARTDDRELNGAIRASCLDILGRAVTHFQNEVVP